MNSVAYSTNCTVFDPKGKILQVSIALHESPSLILAIVITELRSTMPKKP